MTPFSARNILGAGLRGTTKMKRIVFAAADIALSCLPAVAQQRVDFPKLRIKTMDLGNGVNLK